MENLENEILLYNDENGKTNISVRFADEDVWVTAVQLAEIYKTTRQNIGQHLDNIFKDNELPKETTIKKFFIVQQEGTRQVKREIDHYNLDVIIAIGYRVQSDVAVRFRRWATQRLNLLVSEFLDFAEFQALDEKAMKMSDWIEALDNQIIAHKRKILEGNGKISHKQAIEKAEKEYEIFRKKELAGLRSDFDLFIEDINKIK